MIGRFRSFISHHSLFCPEQKGLLAVSGGVDSVVMTHLMYEAGFPFAIAHCNFHLRPGDCDRDEAFVRQLAQQYGVPLYVAQFQTLEYAATHHLSVEDAARQLRYRFFEEIRVAHGYHYVATAHHRDDATETFFLNLIRGTGLSGLHGILPKRDAVVRPLLPFGRDEIEAYAEAHGLSHVEDVTNSSLEYRRNQIRHRLIPLLRELSPSFDATMQSNILHLQDAELIYQSAIEGMRTTALQPHPEGYIIPTDQLAVLQPQLTLLFELLRPFGFNAHQVQQVLTTLGSDAYGQCFYSASHVVQRHAEGLIISERVVEDTMVFAIDSLQQLLMADWPIQASVGPYDASTFSPQPHEAYFDVQQLRFPLLLRRWRQGDRLHPFGMKGTKLVSDLFTQKKLSQFQRRRIWILCDADDRILWVVGLRASSVAQLTPSTTQRLTLRER